MQKINNFIANIKKNKIVVFDVLIICLLFIVCSYLFYLFIFGYRNSDYLDHVEDALNGEWYSLAQCLMVLLTKITKNKISIAIMMSAVTILTIFSSMVLMKKVLSYANLEYKCSYLLLLSISFLFICTICIPEWVPYYYIETTITQPWHNSTFMFMRLFGILVILVFFIIQKHYLQYIDLKENIVFTILLLLVNFAKPNFIIGFAPIMLIYLIYDFCKTKGKSFKNAFYFGLCVLVSCIVLIFQYKVLFPTNGDNTVNFSLIHAFEYITRDKKVFLYIVTDLFFPLYTSFLVYKNRKSINAYGKRIFTQAWLMYILSVLEYMFFIEIGPRETHGNFGWGMKFFGFLLYLVCLCIIMIMKKNKCTNQKFTTIGLVIYCIHIVFGLFYFVLILGGYTGYWI